MVQTWHRIGAESWGSRVWLPRRVAMGGRSDVLEFNGADPNGIVFSKKGSLLLSTGGPFSQTWQNTDGARAWNCLQPCAA